MKIKLDQNHYLVSDPYCYHITCIVTPKDGKPYEKRVSGYVATFGEAVDSYIEKRIKSSEAREITQLKNEIEELKAEVREWRSPLPNE